MKKIIIAILLIAVGSLTVVQGQTNGVIVKNYGEGPHMSFTRDSGGFYDGWNRVEPGPMFLDVNGDGVNDFIFSSGSYFHGLHVTFIMSDADHPHTQAPIHNAIRIPRSDTVGERIDSLTPLTAWLGTGDALAFSGLYTNGEYNFYTPIRMPVPYDSGSYYYGWVHFYVEADFMPNNGDCRLNVTVVESALCTIPNYPFRTGQTSIETKNSDQLTCGLKVGCEGDNVSLTVDGEYGINRAIVVDMNGRVVSTTDNKLARHIVTINMNKKSGGIYLAVAWLENGKMVSNKFVRVQR